MAPSASAIVGGEEDRTRDYVVFVGQQILVPGGAVNTQACSGTLVAPTIVVTAAHCSLLPPGAPPFPLCSSAGQVFCVNYSVRQGDNMRTPDAETTAKSFDLHPLFCATCGFASNHDLGVITLSAPLSGRRFGRLPKADSVEKHFRKTRSALIVGYGTDSPTAPPTSLGPRRNGKVEATLYGANPALLELPGPSRRSVAFACNGDSGGPVLIGRTMQAVISFGDDACGGPTFAYRLDTPSARSFLSQFVELRGWDDAEDEAEDE